MIDRITWTSTTVLYSVIAAISLLSLFSAYTAQYAFNIQPCHLCYYHRYIYMGTALAAILAACRPLGWFLRILNGGLTTILLGLGIGLGAYHTAVEHHWVEPPHACLNARMDGNTIEEVKYEILHEVNVPCNVVGWRFLGLSMTEYSLMAFLFLWLSSLVSMGRLWRERNYP